MSYLTDAEIEALQSSDLDRGTPFLIQGVRQSQFSIARYYGGVKFNGEQYTYFPDTDELRSPTTRLPDRGGTPVGRGARVARADDAVRGRE